MATKSGGATIPTYALSDFRHVHRVPDDQSEFGYNSLARSKFIDGFELYSSSGLVGKFWAQLETLQAALPYMSASGSVVLVTACSSMAKLPGTSGLGAMNGALEIMMPILARELKPIRINAVSPGVVDTPWWDFIPKENRKGAFEQFTANIPVGREAQPAEVADAIFFLAGNAYMTGQVIFCDGESLSAGGGVCRGPRCCIDRRRGVSLRGRAGG